jgi:flagellar biosynthesis/type III secretory pathway ATPase
LGAAINIVVGAFQALVNIIKSVWDWMTRLIRKAHELLAALNPFNHISNPFSSNRSASTRSARSAPTLRAGQSRAAASPAPVTVNVSGALDPESVARQIRSILDGHEMRQGRTVARAMAW